MSKWLSKRNQRFLSLIKKTLEVFFMVKFAEAEARKFHNVFFCKKCKTKVRAPSLKLMAGRISCSKCGGKAFRPVRKK